MTTVLVCDDAPLAREAVRRAVSAVPGVERVSAAGSGEEVLARFPLERPHVVLMDIRMPGTDGIEATRRITGAPVSPGEPDPPRIVILTTFELDEYVYEAVRAGASGFLLKRTPPEELLAGIRTIAGGDGLLSPSVTRRLMHEFAKATTQPGRPTDVTNRDLERLTEREREVLIHLGHGLANREIARELHLAESTVKTHVKRILMKLALRDRVHAIVYAYESGLLAPADRRQ